MGLAGALKATHHTAVIRHHFLPKFWKVTFEVVILGILIFAIGAQWLPSRLQATTHRPEPLTSWLPHAPAGWSSEDVSIADTEVMRARVDEALNFNEGLFRIYRRGGMSFGVYVAYWAPGRFHPRLVFYHVPDFCWTGAGWTMGHEDYARELRAGSTPLWHAQYREFTRAGSLQHVLYWHVYGGRLSGFAEGPHSNSTEFLDTLTLNPFQPRHEQYFIRISSATPFEELWPDPGFQEVMARLAPLGLAAKS